MPTLEEQVRTEQELHDAENGNHTPEQPDELAGNEGAIADAVEQAGLFDGNVYDDPRLELNHNGRRVNVVRVGFLGGFELGRHSGDDIDWFKSLKEGQPFELIASGTVTGTTHVLRATEKHGTQLIETRRLSIDSVEAEDGLSHGGTTPEDLTPQLEELRGAIDDALDLLDDLDSTEQVPAVIEILRRPYATPGTDAEDITAEEQAALAEAADELQADVEASLGDVDAIENGDNAQEEQEATGDEDRTENEAGALLGSITPPAEPDATEG